MFPKLIEKKYLNLNHISINSHSLKSNFNYFQASNPQAKIAPVLKSNAYGHGLIKVAKWIDRNLSAPFICVDSLFEAYELFKTSIKTPILIMGYTDPENFQVWKKLPFHFPVFDTNTLISLNKYQPGAKIHIKIDTGMNRLGLRLNQIPTFIDQLDDIKSIDVVGIYSHCSQADNPKKAQFTKRQVKTFKSAIKIFESRGYQFQWKHIAATSSATPYLGLDKNPNHIIDDQLNLVRLGLGFYGYSPYKDASKELIPALTLSTKIAQIKTVEKGSEIGYGGTFKSSRKMIIALLPMGYYDGIDRRLSNKGVVFHQNKPCQILGRVCMNITIIDISNAPEARVGDTIEVISPNPSKQNSLSKNSTTCQTIPYDLLVNLSESTKRNIV